MGQRQLTGRNFCALWVNATACKLRGELFVLGQGALLSNPYYPTLILYSVSVITTAFWLF